MFSEFLSGYQQVARDACTTFDAGGFGELVVVDHIRFHSLCEHHLLPFFGDVTIGYVPAGHLLGLSKFGRVVDILSKRLQTQERLTHEIAAVISEATEPVGVAVQVSAEHLCMSMRGVRKPGTLTTTSELYGVFQEDGVWLRRFTNHLTERRSYSPN